jgi:amidase
MPAQRRQQPSRKKQHMAGQRLNELAATEVARRIAQGETTARAVVEACLEQAARREPAVLAFEHLDAAGARAAADRLDARRDAAALPIVGACFGIKDIIDTADMPTGYGSPIHAGHQPSADAACVALSRKAGGIALGKTVSTEFAGLHPGRTRHPDDPTRTPGGSSSGSAAAVAAMMLPLALGTQTTASIIRPASYCGVLGFVPGRHEISLSGVRVVAQSLDRLGIFARTVADAALWFDVLRGVPPGPSPETSAFAPRIGLCRGDLAGRMEPGTAAALETLAARLSGAGAVVAEVPIPPAFAAPADAYRAVVSFELVRNLTYEIEQHWDALSTTLRSGGIAAGRASTHAQYLEARRLVAEAVAQIEPLFGPHDVLLAAAAAGEAPQGMATGDPFFCGLWTVLGLPAITLPLLKGANGLPIGAQLLSRPGEEAKLLAAAAWVMRHRDGC